MHMGEGPHMGTLQKLSNRWKASWESATLGAQPLGLRSSNS